MRAQLGAVLLLAGLLVAGCAGDSDVAPKAEGPREAQSASADSFGPAPATPKGQLDEQLAADLGVVFSTLEEYSTIPRREVRRIGVSGDARVAWILSDLLRVETRSEPVNVLVQSFEQLTDAKLKGEERSVAAWKAVTDHLIAWELPAPPGYVDYKARLFTLIEPRWAPFFRDRNAGIDWRFVSWGGVLIDDAIVFGVVINDQARAYPRNIMEVHELVNDTLGGRRIGMPYCTLCASAQAYFTDTVGKRQLVLRTSGLLSRSNKVMYELNTKSVFDTFKGRAISGPLRTAGVTLEQITVVTSTWGAWKAAHPDTTIVARDGGIGQEYPLDPLQGRDDNGPIFPVGDVDPRLPVQEQVVGVIAPGRMPLAFPAAAARGALKDGKQVKLGGVRLELDGDGLRAVDASGDDLVSHQAFWFAWSQFHPGTAVWTHRES